MLTQCCVCMRVEQDGEWTAADVVLYDATHTYCPECEALARREILSYLKMRPSQPGHGAVRSFRQIFNPQQHPDSGA